MEENPEAVRGRPRRRPRRPGCPASASSPRTPPGAWPAIEAADLVILEPAARRASSRSVARRRWRALRPRLCAYVSCNPTSLARDLGQLAAGGLRPVRITPFDMLPHTPHVEVLALLK